MTGFCGYLVKKGGITFDLMILRIYETGPSEITNNRLAVTNLATQANINYIESITIPREEMGQPEKDAILVSVN